MDELRTFYQQGMISVTVLIVFAMLFVPEKLLPFLKRKFPQREWLHGAAGKLTSRLIIVGLFVGGEHLVRTWLWHYVKPEYDFTGDWQGTTTYESTYEGRLDPPPQSKHLARIEQDCLTFTLAPTKSTDYLSWGSKSATLVDKATIHYAYWVDYQGKSSFPSSAMGIEELKVVDRDRRKRPIRMSGTFYHCFQGMKPIYKGTVEFVRVAQTNRIDVTSAHE